MLQSDWSIPFGELKFEFLSSEMGKVTVLFQQHTDFMKIGISRFDVILQALFFEKKLVASPCTKIGKLMISDELFHTVKLFM